MHPLTQSLSVIIADDYPFFRLGVTTFLRSQIPGIRLANASTGIEVIRHLESQPFDIVLLETRIGPLNCVELTKFIKEKFVHTKVIGVTRYPDEFYITEMYRSGAEGVLMKNVGFPELLNAIHAVCDGNKYYPCIEMKTLEQLKKGNVLQAISKKRHIQERLREIIYLVCMDKGSREIASILSLSFRTIEYYRSELNKITNSHGIAGLIKYGLQIDILNDIFLNKKFAKQFSEKNIA